jgi:hypothetical protein
LQPYQTITLFNSFFTPYQTLSNKTMLDLVSTGGGGSAATKAARDVVAAYLNAARFGSGVGGYPFSETQIASMWTDAVQNGTFQNLHNVLAPDNQLGCPAPTGPAASPASSKPSFKPLLYVLTQLRSLGLMGTSTQHQSHPARLPAE